MSGLWSFFGSSKNRERLAFFGGGAVVIVTGLWTAFVYFFPPKSDAGRSGTNVTATSGGVAVGGSVTNSTLTAGSAAGGEHLSKGK